MAEAVRAFVTGHPVAHSRSPQIHGYWLRRYGVPGSYDRVDVAPDAFSDFIGELASGGSGFAGGNVTIPHKEAAFRLSTRPDPVAAELGAANTLWIEDGELAASNTDGYGFAANLDFTVPGWSRAGTAVVLGAGGASRAVLRTLRDLGFERIHLVNRTLERAETLARRFGHPITAHPLDRLADAMRGAGLFVNTTSLGMGGSAVPDIDFTLLDSGAVVTDIVYTPLQTPILAMAARQGFATVDGLGMLLHQAVPGFEKWFGIRPEVTAELRDLIVDDLGGSA